MTKDPNKTPRCDVEQDNLNNMALDHEPTFEVVPLEFARQLERELRALSQGWYSTDERKPEDGQTVLGYWPGNIHGPFSMASLTYHAWDAPDGPEKWLDFQGNEDDAPSHWRLPEPPK